MRHVVLDQHSAPGPPLGGVQAGMAQAIDALREVKAIDAKWATALFNRVFRELNGSKVFLNGISRQIRRALKVCRPAMGTHSRSRRTSTTNFLVQSFCSSSNSASSSSL